MASIGPWRRTAWIMTGVMLGMAIVVGGAYWRSPRHGAARPAEPPAAVPSGSYTAPGSEG